MCFSFVWYCGISPNTEIKYLKLHIDTAGISLLWRLDVNAFEALRFSAMHRLDYSIALSVRNAIRQPIRYTDQCRCPKLQLHWTADWHIIFLAYLSVLPLHTRRHVTKLTQWSGCFAPWQFWNFIIHRTNDSYQQMWKNSFVEIQMKYRLKISAIVFLSGPTVSFGNIYTETRGYTANDFVTFLFNL